MAQILCFDRDFTVDVNFDQHGVYMDGGPVDAEPVPLAWVKHYAHAVEGVDVWATGNQHLRNEAAIPGIREARNLWESYHERSVKPVYESRGCHSYKPGRRDGLRLIQDVYEVYASSEDPLQFVVVDDVDLSDMADEWGEHYFSWDFIDTEEWDVENPAFSDIPVTSSDCDESLEANHAMLDELRGV